MSTTPASTRGLDLAIILGNGVSIAAEPALTLSNLTAEIRDRFNHVGDGVDPIIARTLSKLALQAEPTGDPVHDFESLIGPLNQQLENAAELRVLSRLVSTEAEIKKACDTIGKFVQQLQRQGRGHALDIIAANSVASFDHRLPVANFIEAAVSLVGALGTAVVANLNYDALALASLCDRFGTRFCDAAYGIRGGHFVVSSHYPFQIPGRSLRTELSDFPRGQQGRIKLVHLHGSLCFLRNPDDGKVYKFNIDDLRAADVWAQWRDGLTGWEPCVVLTNQSAKSEEIGRDPFHLAYDVLRQQLRIANRWLIAGYSFRDECVNAVLAEELLRRGSMLPIMVVTQGGSPTIDEVVAALNPTPFFDASKIAVYRHGIENVPVSKAWSDWSGVALVP